MLSPTYAAAAGALPFRSHMAAPVAIASLVYGFRSVRTCLPDCPSRDAMAVRLAVRGLLCAVRQEPRLLLRHWWPAAALGAIASRQVRTALVSAMVVDAVVVLSEQGHPKLGLATTTAARRLDDLAYGAGLWWAYSGLGRRAHYFRVARDRNAQMPGAMIAPWKATHPESRLFATEYHKSIAMLYLCCSCITSAHPPRRSGELVPVGVDMTRSTSRPSHPGIAPCLSEVV